MREPHDLNQPADDADLAFEVRLRGVRPAAPRLDRDRLMFLAGRRSAPKPRRNVIWPVLAITSWVSCAAVAGLLVARPPEVVTSVRVVERIVEVPVEVARERPRVDERSPVVSETPPRGATTSPEWSPAEFARRDRPLTILSSRPSRSPADEPLAMATPGLPARSAEPSPPVSYGELRRELLPGRRGEPAATFRWF